MGCKSTGGGGTIYRGIIHRGCMYGLQERGLCTGGTIYRGDYLQDLQHMNRMLFFSCRNALSPSLCILHKSCGT